MAVNLKRTILAFAAAGALAGALATPAAHAAEQVTPPRQSWSFSGPFGKYDPAQLQRGFKVYKEVCAACHSMNLLRFRNLAEPGGPEFSLAQAAAVAAEYKIKDGPNEQGEMFERDGRIADAFPAPFPNDAAARAANGGVLPPDMSVIAKARTYERGFPWFVLDMFTQYQEQGPDYLTALMLGYREKPADFTMPSPTMQYNMYFPGHAIGMPPPLSNDRVTYDDGAPQTLEQYSKDVSAFLMWIAEPHLVARKRLGFQVMIFLIVFAGLLYFTKKKVWHAVDLEPGAVEKKA
ncbi:MAG: cytochrome c1 [Rhizobiales bacterium]|nr:cytochrome c1 [Hyphomicrobiales bacterium]